MPTIWSASERGANGRRRSTSQQVIWSTWWCHLASPTARLSSRGSWRMCCRTCWTASSSSTLMTLPLCRELQLRGGTPHRVLPSPFCHTCPALLNSHICTSLVTRKLLRPQTLRDWLPDHLMLLYWVFQMVDIDRLLDLWNPACEADQDIAWSCLLCLGIKMKGFNPFCVLLLGPILSPETHGVNPMVTAYER